MALTRVSGGILKQPIDVGIITATSLNASGIITAGTVQVGSATTIHTTGIDLGSGNVTSHNINSTGIITATSFVGPVTGNVTGNASGTAGGLTGSPSISVTNITASGNVSIAGTLTYEDVTNIDSVGVITARSGIDVSGDITLTDTDTGSAAGPELKLFRNSASPADADYLGQIKFAGESDTGVERNYAKITGKISDASNGTEDGIIEFAFIKAGSQNINARFKSTELQLLNGTHLSLGDSQEIRVGASDDLQIYHDASHSYIEESGTGALKIKGDDIRIENTSSRNVFKAVGTACELFFDNGSASSKKLETTSAGLIIHEDTNKTISFTGGIGEIGNVTGFQALNTAGSALVDFGMRANTLRFATGSAERLRILSDGAVIVGDGTNWAKYVSDANFQITDDTNAKLVISNPGNATFSLAVGTGNDLIIRDESQAADRMTIDYSTGNIGIGTASPAQKLEVNSGGTANGVSLNTTYAGGPNIAFKVNGSIKSYIGSGGGFSQNGDGDDLALRATDNLLFDIAGSEKVRIDSSGRLLVGTNTAYNEYNSSNNGWNGGHYFVSGSAGWGTAHFTDWDSDNTKNSYGGNSIYISRCKSDTVNSHSGGGLVNGEPIARLIFNGSDGSAFRNAAHIQVNVDGVVSSGQMPGAIIFSTSGATSSSPTEKMRVDANGEVITTKGTNISYVAPGATITDNLVFESRNPIRLEPAASQFYDMKAFVPSKSGSVAMNATMYIKSGTHYFVFRVIDEDGTVVFNAADGGGFDSYDNPAGQSGSVHNYKIYKWVCPNLKADKKYKLQMAASNAAGTSIYASGGQWMYCKDFRVYSKSPGMTYASNIHILQDVDYGTSAQYGGTAHDFMSPSSNNSTINHYQNFTGTESKFMGWFTTRAYNRYLDIKFNLTSSMMWFAQAYGYLYGYGHVCGSMISGYSYTGTQILNKVNHTFGSRGWYGSYRTSNGNLCLKFDHGGNGYTEGTLAIFFGGHSGSSASGIHVIEYKQNDSTSNAFS